MRGMKNILCSTFALVILLGGPAIYGDQPMHGVTGVVVMVKENPAKRVVTDASGNFALQGLAPGQLHVCSSEGAEGQRHKNGVDHGSHRCSVVFGQSRWNKASGKSQRGFRSTPGRSRRSRRGGSRSTNPWASRHVRKRQKMVWIAAGTGSHIPGHWAPADLPEAKGHSARQTQWMKGSDVQGNDRCARPYASGRLWRLRPIRH